MSKLYQFLQAISLSDEMPRRVGIRRLSREMPTVFAELQKKRVAAVVTYRGYPQFLLVPLDPDQMPALAWSANPELYEDDMRHADDTLLDDLREQSTMEQEPVPSPR